ncbi:RNA-binding protein, putative [Bodo saltans]|uniref:RNA-binding protein, putative n=1 Tax=Bodo saltans TaxID=75058 RepID=A0A0S4JE94_BODSA|nr:RNA-binding protein, putative [Bodo saltans]|eukprot:CUG88612.1 RNA-binding protein, putative [Bodo saltans]
MSGKTIRFEDLGEPVQRLLKSIKGGVSDEDMALLEFVSVKDMAKIYGEMSTDRQAKEIWEELRTALQARREKSDKKKAEIDNRVEELEDQRRREEEAERAAEEQERLDREAEEAARQARKEDRRRRRAEAEAAAQAEEEDAAAAAAAEQEAREEEERQAAEEAERKRRDAKRKKREARARELAEEQEALAAEQARSAKKKANQKKEWADYVASHPLDFPDGGAQNIEQVAVEKSTKPPPKITEDLLNRTYTPKCPNCSAKFSKPPTEWDCPLCLKRLKTKVKVWQPDDDSNNCLVCKGSIGRFSRHHCRNCGRLVCNKCCEHKALIPQIGYKDPVKVCNDCAGVGTPSA